MKKIYKLLDLKTEEYIKENLISLSRPIYEFGEYEGKSLDFIYKINKLRNGGQDISNIKRNLNIIETINKWYSYYLKCGRIEDTEENRQSYFSDMQIIIFMYLNTYCSSFTNINLENKEKRIKYHIDNRSFIKKFNKTRIIGFDVDNEFHDGKHLLGKENKGKLVFDEVTNNDKGINGWEHLRNVKYDSNCSEVKAIQRFYKDRRLSSLLTLLPAERCQKQSETRLFVVLTGNLPNSSIIANKTSSVQYYDSFEEKMVEHVFNAIVECEQNYPKYIYLKVNKPYYIDI